jgi:hypothetical protein
MKIQPVGVYLLLTALTAVALPPALWAQEAEPEVAAAEGGANPGEPRMIQTKDGHLRVDLKKREVTVEAQVCLLDDHEALEFLLSGWEQKMHESLLHTKATGRQIHFAMLMLGLKPGKPFEWIYIDENRSASLPPRGGGCSIQIRYTDERGKTHTVDAADWIRPGEGVKAAPPEKFIFVGSRILADGEYWADQEGELISVANFGSAVFDVPFESTSSNANLMFAPNRDKMMSRGTKVQLIITPLPGAKETPHVRSLVEVDRLGRLRADGEPIEADKLRQWAANLSKEHLKAMVEVRAAPDATVGQVRWILDELKLGGIFEREVIRLTRLEEFPKTPEARKRLLLQWSQKFADPANQIVDPAKTSARTIAEAKARMAELEDVEHILQEYVDDLQRMREEYLRDKAPVQSP